jgi:hypothetical protein
MKHSTIAFIFLFIISCTTKKEVSNTGQESVQLTVDSTVHTMEGSEEIPFVMPDAENSEEFLSLFKDIDPNGLHIFTSQSEGNSIDVRKYKYVHNQGIFFNIEACKRGHRKIFAIGKFDLNNEHLALITRQHSQYTESLVQLLLWDKQQQKIYKGITLADGFGDEGWYFDIESWIKTFQFDKELSVVTWRKDSEYDENFTHKTIKDTLTITHFKGATFETKALNRKDTSGLTLKNWR